MLQKIADPDNSSLWYVRVIFNKQLLLLIQQEFIVTAAQIKISN